MGNSAKKLATIEDLLNLPEKIRADLINGEIEYRASPTFQHETIVDSLIAELYTKFRGPKRPSGTGGWWIATSTLIRFANGKALCPDIAGWKRDRVKDKPTGFPVIIKPDWVCEVSFSTRKKDSTVVPQLLLENEIPWYWRFDVEDENLLVYEYSEKGYIQKMSLFREDIKVKIPPFEAAEFSMPLLLGDDPVEE